MSTEQKDYEKICNRTEECFYGKTVEPQKPFLEGDGYFDGELVYDTWYCPNCNTSYEIDFEHYKFCPECGQAIDWSEEK